MNPASVVDLFKSWGRCVFEEFQSSWRALTNGVRFLKRYKQIEKSGT